jgi:hypothetical protein
VAADEGADARAVDTVRAAEIEHEVTAAAGEQLLDALLVALRGAAAHERFLGRDQDLSPRRTIHHDRSSTGGMLARDSDPSPVEPRRQ